MKEEYLEKIGENEGDLQLNDPTAIIYSSIRDKSEIKELMTSQKMILTLNQ